jgi:hypothetical protein
MTTIHVAEQVDRSPSGAAAATRRRPVQRWAAAGVCFVVLQAYLYSRWIGGLLAGGIHSVGTGSTPVPGWMTAAVWVHITIGFVAVPVLLYWNLVRPWRRDRRVTSDALLMLACLTAFWQDLLSNAFHYNVVYNAAWPNLGAWYGFLPGWQTPRGNVQAEAMIFFLPMYVACMFGFTTFGCGAMRRVQRRHPGVSGIRLFFVAWGTMALIDFVLEVGWVRLGLYSYAGAWKPLTLFYGHYYQFPLTVPMIWGFGWALFSSLRFFRDPGGGTVVERGIESSGGGERRMVLLRFLALSAAANLMLLTYSLLTWPVAQASGHWPADVTKRSYLVGRLCGPGADYACPRPEAR